MIAGDGLGDRNMQQMNSCGKVARANRNNRANKKESGKQLRARETEQNWQWER